MDELLDVLELWRGFFAHFREEIFGFEGFLVLLQVQHFRILGGFFVPGLAVVLKFLDDDKHIEDGAYFRAEFSVFLSLLSDEGVDFLLSEFLEDFAHESLLNVVGFIEGPLLELFGREEWYIRFNFLLLSLFGRHGGNLKVGFLLQLSLLSADPEAGVLRFQ